MGGSGSSKADQSAVQAKVMGKITRQLKEDFPQASTREVMVCADAVMKKV